MQNRRGFLLERGADPFGTSPAGDTPLTLTVRLGWSRLSERLITLGVDLDARDSRGMSALHLAAALGREAMLKQLVANGASPQTRAADGQTPLGVALSAGRRDLADWLDWRGWPLPRRALQASDVPAAAIVGDATELFVLERAGIKRPPDLLIAATGDDEDNIIICQLAREKYGVPKVIARVNDPRNQAHFDLLGISPTVSATRGLMALIEHEVPEHDLVHLLELRKENLEIVEVQIDKSSPCAGTTVEKLRLPEGARLISVMRDGKAEIAVGKTELRPGDQVLAILQPGKEDELRQVLLKK